MIAEAEQKISDVNNDVSTLRKKNSTKNMTFGLYSSTSQAGKSLKEQSLRIIKQPYVTNIRQYEGEKWILKED